MDFEKVVETVIADFNQERINYALIGGFGMAVLGISRSTVDLDILLYLEDVKSAKRILSKYYYRCIYESENVSQYVSDLKPFGQIDILHSFRKASRSMLERAKKVRVYEKEDVSVLNYEDIIGLKLQALRNDPARGAQDWGDVTHIITHMTEENICIDWGLLEDYFSLFDFDEKFKVLKKSYGTPE